MINKGFTYCIPPYMIRSDVVTGVMSFEEMDAMMYKIEGEDLYLIGTSEHSMIGKFKGQILKKEDMPYTMTSYSPCFRKEKGAHGLEERGVYRIHQFEKQEMIVVCEPEDSWDWYNKMWSYTVEFFRSMNIPVRTLECCSGDLADLKAKSCDVEAWSPRQKKYFEVGSCSNLTDAQARRLGIRIKGEKGNYFAHTLNNTVVAPPRMLIAIMENNYQPEARVYFAHEVRTIPFGRYIKTKKAFADRLCKMLWHFRTFLAADAHQTILFGKSLFKFLILSVVIIKNGFIAKLSGWLLLAPGLPINAIYRMGLSSQALC